MYYIKSSPNEKGNYGNPMGQFFPGAVALPDAFLPVYIDAMGFVHLQILGNEVVAVGANQDALDGYLAEHPSEPSIEPELTPEERMAELEAQNAMLTAQVQALSQQNDFHEELIVELANVVYA